MLDEASISSHVQGYIEKKKVSVTTGGSKSKLDERQTLELMAHVEGHTYMRVAEICEHVQATYGITYTVAGMTCWLHRHRFSYKKPHPTPAKADGVKQAAFIKTYHNLLKATPEDEPILFADGVHPTMATKIAYGWIRRGTDKPLATTASRTRMNLMGAINLETMGVTIGSFETLDSEAMVQYLRQLKKAYPKAPKIHLVLDRGPYNTSMKTRETAEELGIKLHHLPPYSPNLNPIERLWKVMNEHVRNNQFFKEATEFRQRIMDFFHITWPKIASSMTGRINDNFQTLKYQV